MLQRQALLISRKRLISPCCVTAFYECGNLTRVCIRRMQLFRVSATFPHPTCIDRSVLAVPVPDIPKRLLPAHRFSVPRSPTCVGFPLTHTRLCCNYNEFHCFDYITVRLNLWVIQDMLNLLKALWSYKNGNEFWNKEWIDKLLQLSNNSN